MRELLLEIWASIRRNKLRTFLTGFSVAWGIFMLVILLGSGNGLKNGTLSNFGSMAVNSVIINGGWTSQPYKGYDKWRRINITNRDLEILRTEFPEVDKVSARVQGPGQYNLSHGRDFLNNAAVVGNRQWIVSKLLPDLFLHLINKCILNRSRAVHIIRCHTGLPAV